MAYNRQKKMTDATYFPQRPANEAAVRTLHDGMIQEVYDMLELSAENNSGAHYIKVAPIPGVFGGLPGKLYEMLLSLKEMIANVVLGQIPDNTLTDAKLSDAEGAIKDRVSTISDDVDYFNSYNIPRDYDPTTDTGTDATTIVNTYLQDCKTNKKRAFFRGGKYKFDGQVVIPDQLDVMGEGLGSALYFEDTGGGVAWHFTGSNDIAVEVQGRRGVFKNISLINRNGLETRTLLDLTQASYKTFRNVILEGYSTVKGTGVRIRNNGNFNSFYDVNIYNLNKGISFEKETADSGDVSNANTFVDCLISDCNYGVYASGDSASNSFFGLRFESNEINDMYLDKSFYGNHFYGCRSEGCVSYPIVINNAEVFDNTFEIMCANENVTQIVHYTRDRVCNRANRIIPTRFRYYANQKAIQFTAQENKITHETGRNLISNARRPIRSVYNPNSLVIAKGVIDSDGYEEIVITGAATDSYIEFYLPDSFLKTIQGMMMAAGAFIKADAACSISFGGLGRNADTLANSTNGLFSFTLGTNYDFISTNLFPKYDADSMYAMYITIPANRTITLKHPIYSIGSSLFLNQSDIYTMFRDISGTTAKRPTSPPIGFPHYDTDLGVPIYYNGSVWKRFDTNATV